MQIHGIEGLTPEQLRAEVRAGARFVIFSYCFSIVVMTFRRGTDIYLVRAGESAAGKSLPWTMISLVFGWWGFPFGLVFTPICIIQNLAGGKDVTADVVGALNLEGVPPPAAMLGGGVPGQPGSDVGGAPGAVSGGVSQGWVATGQGMSGAPGAVSGGMMSGGAPGWVAPQQRAQPAKDPVATQAGWSLALGFFSLACCAPLGWIGAVLGVLAMKKARELERPTPGLAVAGIVLSAFSTLAMFGFIAFAVKDSRERDARIAALNTRAKAGRAEATLSKATACTLVEAGLVDGLYGSRTAFQSVNCDGELEETSSGMQFSPLRGRWDDNKTEVLTACFVKSNRWFLLSLAPNAECPATAPATTLRAGATDLEAQAEEERLQEAAKTGAKTPPASARVDSLGGSRTQVPIGEDADFPHLELDVVDVHRAQKPTDAPPFYAPGGEWTYFDVAVHGQPAAKVTVGTRVGKGADAFSFGDAVLVGGDRAAGAKFLQAYAKAFHVDVPPEAKPPTPLEPFTFRTAVLAQNVKRAEGGGFGDEKGTWTATKWFPARDGLEVEIFFNYDLVGRHAELSDKDPGYDQDFAEVLARTVRDGPRPPRTPQNDVTLAASGPRLEDFKQVSKGHQRTWVEPTHLLLVAQLPKGQALMRLDFATGATSEVCRVEHVIERADEAGARTLVQETIPSDPAALASTDPSRLVLCEGGKGHVLELTDTAPRLELLTQSLSPDGRYVAAGHWVGNANDKGQHEVVVLHDLESKWETSIESGDDSFNVVGWRQDKGEPVAELEKGLVWDPPDRRSTLDYFLIAKKQVVATRPVRAEREVTPLSPGGSQRFSVEKGKALVVTEVRSGKARRLELHPDDRRFADDGSFTWLDERYLRFEAGRPALVDTKTMKVWFPLPPEDTATLEYSADFKTVVKSSDDGVFVGRVVPAK